MLKRLMPIGKSVHQLKIELINLNEEIKNTVTLLQGAIPSNIKIEVSLCEDLSSINADVAAMDEIITNLILNAIQAMSDGGLIEIGTDQDL